MDHENQPGGAASAGRPPDALMRAVARDRDRAAFAELFRYYAPRVKAYLMRLGADGETAEELMQEVMVVVWRRADSFDPQQAGLGTWIFTIARNRRIDALRRDRRPAFDPSDAALQPPPSEPADALVAGAETERRVQRALERLPKEQADLVMRAYFDDQSHSTIAEQTELPLGTVKSRLRLALARLRRLLQDAA